MPPARLKHSVTYVIQILGVVLGIAGKTIADFNGLVAVEADTADDFGELGGIN